MPEKADTTSGTTEISVGIIMCSRQRPELLSRALDSLAALAIPENCRVRFAVVENDPTPIYGDIIERFSQTMPIEHIVEPTPGLCHARNKALDTAIGMGVDWMGSVDDDMVIDQNWLVHMVAAIRAYPDTDMFVGQWRRIEPDNTPAWYPASVKPSTKPTGTLIRSGAGGNTVFSARVFSPGEMGLRFDQAFVSIPGEDTDFGMQYLAKGGKMRHVLEAVTTEEIHLERHSMRDRISRIEWSYYSRVLIRKKHNPKPVALFWDFQTVYRGAVLGGLNMAAGVVLWPLDGNWGKNRIATGRMFVAQARGVFRYYFGKAEGLYLNKTGR